MEISGAEILHRAFPDIAGKKFVDRAVESYQRQTGEKVAENKQERVDTFLQRFEQIFNEKDLQKQHRKVKIFTEKFIYPNVLIDPNNIPESHFQLHKRINRERGYGDTQYNQRQRLQEGKAIYQDQKKSLSVWFDYLSSSDINYDPWFKYYVLNSVIKMGTYDKEKKSFSKRDETTTTVFPELNHEALAFTYDVLKRYYLEGKEQNDKDIKTVLDSTNFSRIYAYAIENVTPASKENKEKTEGQWEKFNKGSDPTALYESLRGHGTGWCIAGGLEVAKNHLQAGDLYIYYTKNDKNQYTIPRIAIRMEGGQVAEVRGIEKNQNLEANMIDIAKEKYQALPGGDRFDKKSHDMKLLTEIDKKNKTNQNLSVDELKFLYEIDYRIDGFGYKKDPRIEEIKNNRDLKKDLSFIFNCSSQQISTDQLKAFRNDIKCQYGSITLSQITSIKNLEFLEDGHFYGSEIMSLFLEKKYLTFPEIVVGDVFLTNLSSPDNLVLPKKRIFGNLYLNSLSSINGLIFPETIDGNLVLNCIDYTKNLILPNVRGTIHLGSMGSIRKAFLRKRYPNLRIE